jgi:cAMP phosphodiesterase
LDERIVFDGGSLTNVLDAKAQLRIADIFVTHAHLDHAMGILFLLDNIIVSRIWHRINILGLPRTIKTIRKNLLNSSVWPDFTVIPDADNQILTLTELKADRPILIEATPLLPTE